MDKGISFKGGALEFSSMTKGEIVEQIFIDANKCVSRRLLTKFSLMPTSVCRCVLVPIEDPLRFRSQSIAKDTFLPSRIQNSESLGALWTIKNSLNTL